MDSTNKLYIGGALLFAGILAVVWTSKKPGAAAGPDTKPSDPKGGYEPPSSNKTTGDAGTKGTVSPGPQTMSDTNKAALWRALNAVTLQKSATDPNQATLSQTPPATGADAASAILASKNEGAGGLYVLLQSTATKTTFWLTNADTASLAGPTWTLFLVPNEWHTVAAAAATDASAAPSGTLLDTFLKGLTPGA